MNDDQFAHMWNAGLPRNEIAQHFGLSPQTIKYHRRRLGLIPRKASAKVDRVDRAGLGRFAEWLSEGYSVSAIARAMGISQQRGSQMLARLRGELGWQAQ